MSNNNPAVGLHRLAKLVYELQYDDLPDAVKDHAASVLLDTVGVIIWGAQDPFLRDFRHRYLDRQNKGSATVLGTARQVEAGHAAMFNAAACTVTQIDEGHRRALGHPGIHIIPTVLAIAERESCSGAEVIAALVAGYETAVRIGRAVRPLRTGIHAHGHWPVIPAAMAGAKLLGADTEALMHCLESASTLTLFPATRTATDGVTSHHLFAGLGAQIAVTVAYGAGVGMTGSRNLFSDYFVPLSTERFKAELLTEGLDGPSKRFEILNSYFKFQPVCAHAITSIEAVDAMRHMIADPQNIERVTIRTYGLAAELSSQEPATTLAAKFSLPFVVASRLLYPDSRLAALHVQNLADPALKKLMKRVVIVLDKELDREYPDRRPAVVEIEMADGSQLKERRNMPLGDADNPASRVQLEAKFDELAAPVLGEEQAAHLRRTLLRIGHLDNVQSVMAAARTA